MAGSEAAVDQAPLRQAPKNGLRGDGRPQPESSNLAEKERLTDLINALQTSKRPDAAAGIPPNGSLLSAHERLFRADGSKVASRSEPPSVKPTEAADPRTAPPNSPVCSLRWQAAMASHELPPTDYAKLHELTYGYPATYPNPEPLDTDASKISDALQQENLLRQLEMAFKPDPPEVPLPAGLNLVGYAPEPQPTENLQSQLLMALLKGSHGQQPSFNQYYFTGSPAPKPSLQKNSSGSLYKTELCRSWSQTSSCRYGSKCQFAHGVKDQRPVQRHPKYKTELCRTYSQTGTCPYGARCRFIHQHAPLTPLNAAPYMTGEAQSLVNAAKSHSSPDSIASSYTNLSSPLYPPPNAGRVRLGDSLSPGVDVSTSALSEALWGSGTSHAAFPGTLLNANLGALGQQNIGDPAVAGWGPSSQALLSDSALDRLSLRDLQEMARPNPYAFDAPYHQSFGPPQNQISPFEGLFRGTSGLP